MLLKTRDHFGFCKSLQTAYQCCVLICAKVHGYNFLESQNTAKIVVVFELSTLNMLVRWAPAWQTGTYTINNTIVFIDFYVIGNGRIRPIIFSNY